MARSTAEPTLSPDRPASRSTSHLTAGPQPTNGTKLWTAQLRPPAQGSDHVAKPDLGSKRHCQNCGAKFFDLNKSPILCPKCGAEFEAVALTRAPARAAAVADDEDAPVDPAHIELVSIE